MIEPDPNAVIPTELGSVHFVGIGGAGMSGIARLFLDLGHVVTGSDRTESATVAALRERGARIAVGHDAANVGDADTVVVTSALWPDNPEYRFALDHGVPVLHRSQALAWLVSDHRLVSIAGAHGKTTSAGMVITALRALGADPGFVNGGVLSALGTSSAVGSGELFVAETDESDGSFLAYDTAIALITNVDADHLDHYGSSERFEQAFVDFAHGAREFVVVSADDPGARRVRARLRPSTRVVTFGRDPGADVRLTSVVAEGPVAFTLESGSRRLHGRLTMPGEHNAVNAAGAVAVLVGLGYDAADALEAVCTFAGTGRRFESHGSVRGVRVYDDYAHHPTEVAAVLSAARSVVGDGRLIAVHQPHLYSRTRRLAPDFARVLGELADHTVVLDVCGAREDPIPGVTGALVAEAFADPDAVSYRPDWSEAAARTAELADDGDLVVTLGCGDVNLIIPQLLDALAGTGYRVR